MAIPFNFRDYESAHDSLPSILWRVTHADTQGRQLPITREFEARGKEPIADVASLKLEAANHFNWNSRKPSLFLSVFTNKNHAENWGQKRLNLDKVSITPII